MPTTALSIIQAATKSSLTHAAQLTADTNEILAFLNRKVAQVYTVLGMPPEEGGASRGDFFAGSDTITVDAASPPTMPADASFRHLITNAQGEEVAVVTRVDLVRGVAELPPAVVIEGGRVRSAGRTGDPVDDDVLTVRFTQLPGTLTLTSHWIGATTVTDGSTSQWPSHVADPWLIAQLRRYLAAKKTDATEQEIADAGRDLDDAATIFAGYVGVNASRLTSLRD